MNRRLTLLTALVSMTVATLGGEASAQKFKSWHECRMDATIRIQGTGTIFPGGELDCYGFSRETGTYEGVVYSVLFDGSGYIQGEPKWSDQHSDVWHLVCAFDDIDEDHSCAIFRSKFMSVWITGRDQTIYVSVGTDNHPGTVSALKVDDNGPWKIEADSEGAYWGESESSQILKQLESGEEIIAAYAEWPSEARKQETQSLWGFRQALEVLRRVHSRVMTNQ